jgi:uncharacterized protein (DUF433 family)
VCWLLVSALEGSHASGYSTVPVKTRFEDVVLHEDRVPEIAGTTLKVVELIIEQQTYGWSTEELHFQHPYLTLEQIHSALAYSWDHREELHCNVRRRLQLVDGLRRTLSMSRDQRGIAV